MLKLQVTFCVKFSNISSRFGESKNVRICSNVNGIPSIQSIPIISAHFFYGVQSRLYQEAALFCGNRAFDFQIPTMDVCVATPLVLNGFPYSCSIVKCLSRTLVKGVSAVGNPVSSISPNLLSVIGKLSRFGLSLMLPTIYILFVPAELQSI